MERLDAINTIYEQQNYTYDNHARSMPDRIVSVSPPFVRPFIRGKAGKTVEFGAGCWPASAIQLFTESISVWKLLNTDP